MDHKHSPSLTNINLRMQVEDCSRSQSSGLKRSIHSLKKSKIKPFNTSSKIIQTVSSSGQVSSSTGVCACMEMASLIVIMLKKEVIMLRFKMRTWVFSDLNAHRTQAIQLRSAEELSMGLSTGLHELV